LELWLVQIDAEDGALLRSFLYSLEHGVVALNVACYTVKDDCTRPLLLRERAGLFSTEFEGQIAAAARMTLTSSEDATAQVVRERPSDGGWFAAVASIIAVFVGIALWLVYVAVVRHNKRMQRARYG
jgi:hypothetical protein